MILYSWVNYILGLFELRGSSFTFGSPAMRLSSSPIRGSFAVIFISRFMKSQRIEFSRSSWRAWFRAHDGIDLRQLVGQFDFQIFGSLPEVPTMQVVGSIGYQPFCGHKLIT